MGSFKSTQKTKTNQTESATTKPITPDYVEQPIKNMIGKIDQFAGMDPKQFVAPASPLQEKAFADASGLGGWQTAANDAIAMAKAATGQGPNLATSGTYTAPTLGNAAQVDPVTLGAIERIDPQSLLDGLPAYMSPHTDQVVKTTLAGYDADADAARAALKAAGAKAGAFGGSRFGLAQGEFEADTGRDRALTEAQLRDLAFQRGTALSADDANRRQGAAGVNAGAANARNLAQGGIDLQRGIYNTDAVNDFARRAAELKATEGMFNTDLAAKTSMFNAGQGDVAANRDLAAAGLVANTAANIGAGTRADTALTGDLGTMQQAIEQAQRSAVPTQLQILSGLYGNLPYPALIGQQMNGTMSGTSTSKTSPGFGLLLMQAASNAAQAAAMGAG